MTSASKHCVYWIATENTCIYIYKSGCLVIHTLNWKLSHRLPNTTSQGSQSCTCHCRVKVSCLCNSPYRYSTKPGLFSPCFHAHWSEQPVDVDHDITIYMRNSAHGVTSQRGNTVRPCGDVLVSCYFSLKSI